MQWKALAAGLLLAMLAGCAPPPRQTVQARAYVPITPTRCHVYPSTPNVAPGAFPDASPAPVEPAYISRESAAQGQWQLEKGRVIIPWLQVIFGYPQGTYYSN